MGEYADMAIGEIVDPSGVPYCDLDDYYDNLYFNDDYNGWGHKKFKLSKGIQCMINVQKIIEKQMEYRKKEQESYVNSAISEAEFDTEHSDWGNRD